MLGYICWGKEVQSNSASFDEILAEYDYYLQEFSYTKIWEEMSPTDRTVARAIANGSGRVKVKDICEEIDMYAKKFSVYRDRLKKKGLLDTSSYGELSFSLPRFAEFVREMPD